MLCNLLKKMHRFFLSQYSYIMQLGQRILKSGYNMGQKLGQGALNIVGQKLIPRVVNYGVRRVLNGVQNKVAKSILER